MKILQLTSQSITVGGIGRYVSSLTDALTALGHECRVLSRESSGTESEGEWAEHAPWLIMSNREKGWQQRMLSDVAAMNPDIIVCHDLKDGALLDRLIREGFSVSAMVHGSLCPVGKLFRREDRVCTHAMSARCLWDWYAGPCGSTPNVRKAVILHRRAKDFVSVLQSVPLVLVGTRFMSDYVIQEGICPECVYVIDWLPRMKPDRVVIPVQCTGQHSLLFVGRLAYNKGVQYLLGALAELDASYTLRIAGDGWYRGTLEEQCMKLGISDRVRFLGMLAGADLAKEYQRAEVVIVPSIYLEAQGLVVGEAAAYGVRVIVSDVGGLPEWGERGVDVVTVPPADVPQLVTTIRRVCSMGTVGNANVATMRDNDKALDNLVAKLEKVAYGKKYS